MAAKPRATRFSVTILLGGGIAPDGSLPRWVEPRLDEAYRLYSTGDSGDLLMSGKGKHRYPATTEAEAMREGLVERGIPEELIRLEDRSRNTLENFGYSRFDLLEPMAVPYRSRVAVITSRFTAERVGLIAEWVLRPHYKHQVIAVPDQDLDPGALARRAELEERLIEFNNRELFPRIEKGDRDRLRAFFYDPADPLKKRYDEFEVSLDLSHALY